MMNNYQISQYYCSTCDYNYVGAYDIVGNANMMCINCKQAMTLTGSLPFIATNNVIPPANSAALAGVNPNTIISQGTPNLPKAGLGSK